MGSLVVLGNCIDTGWGLDRSRHKKLAWLCSKQSWPWFIIWCLPEFRRTKFKFQARWNLESETYHWQANLFATWKTKKDFAWYLSTNSWFLVEIDHLAIFLVSNLIPSHPQSTMSNEQVSGEALSLKQKRVLRWKENWIFLQKNRRYQFDFDHSKFSSTLFLSLFVTFFCWVQQGIMKTKGTL